MWTMGYNDHENGGITEFNNNNNNMPGEYCGGGVRKLRPLIPRLPVVLPANPTATTSPPCLGRIHDHFFGCSHFGCGDENKNRNDLMINTHTHTPVVVSSSRWNPTPEQLRSLEELYRRGTRTPSADQIQHITSQLRRYGKIEGKNVFYWFQNHKARERQKRRRQMEMESSSSPPNLERKDSADCAAGANRTSYEVEQTKNWPPPTNCSSAVAPEESVVSIQRAECRAGGCCRIQFDEGRELIQHRDRRNLIERNATWQMMQLSCPSPGPTHLMINTTTTPTTTNTNTNPSPLMDPNHQQQQLDLNTENDHAAAEESQTLELFPLRSEDNGVKNNVSTIVDDDESVNVAPYQFFEFLPLKK